jgi:hypothetical protein
MLDFGQGKTMALTVTNPFSSEETTADFLLRREHELTSRLAALRGQMAPLEAELEQVQKMRSMIPQPDPGPVLEKLASIVAAQEAARSVSAAALTGAQKPDATATNAAVNPSAWPPNPFAPATNALVQPNPYAGRTIKDLVIQALIDGFPEGANTKQLRNFILSGYRRAIDAGVLRTQLHRLKASGILGRDPSTDTWNFQDGQRALYARYDHPTSRASMTQLKDDPVSDEIDYDSPFIKQVEALAWKDDQPESDPAPAEVQQGRVRTVVPPWAKDGSKK